MIVPTVFTVDLASGATLTSSSVDLGWGFTRVYLKVPTMASGNLFVQASDDNSNFVRVAGHQITTATAHAFPDFQIPSTVTNRWVPVPLNGFRYVKIENSSGATDTTTVFKIVTSD